MYKTDVSNVMKNHLDMLSSEETCVAFDDNEADEFETLFHELGSLDDIVCLRFGVFLNSFAWLFSVAWACWIELSP